MIKKIEDSAAERLIILSFNVTIYLSRDLLAENTTIASAYYRNRKFFWVKEKQIVDMKALKSNGLRQIL